ncbi:hypothetical protein [Marinobacter oulmenensis]|uniref:Oxidoreductase molybdopterin-binding domain-containing protein n=1 Tax=Marinobacter oulmenensis TaxID=643747 RepID=A0A840UAF1_9GAMM|nr:hypothetical protein [Marinobacter oulmenensis]MBB5321962.1 hypothetical protein [Marinobacter oulmenensis]
MRLFPAVLMSALAVFAPWVSASVDSLLIVDGDRRIDLPITELRERADLEFTFYAPYRGRDVTIRGIALTDLLAREIGRVPERIRLEAHDGYIIELDDWASGSWVLVTHEDGEPLTLRQQGPVRLVERDYGDRNPEHLRSFNLWVWMLKSIEAL